MSKGYKGMRITCIRSSTRFTALLSTILPQLLHIVGIMRLGRHFRDLGINNFIDSWP